MILAGSLLHRLVLYVSLGLLIFAALAGGLVYRVVFEQQLQEAAAVEQQLVHTVRAQAEVAVFARNTNIAEGVIEGLRATPRILAARIAGDDKSALIVGAHAPNGAGAVWVTDYPLFSPVDGKTRIGVLTVTRHQELIRTEATAYAWRLTALLLTQILATAALILFAFGQLIGKPITKLARDLSAIVPGGGQRIVVAASHRRDEIGSLANNANALIDAAENALAEVRALATTDALTGLPNRRAFLSRLALELARLQRREDPCTSVLMIDLDHFKGINDHHGHGAGDAVLIAFGALLSAEMRKVDAAGRLGGEEFAVLLPGSDLAAAGVFAERFRRRLAEMKIDHGGLCLRVTASVGVSALDPSDERPEDALARADQALYRAKAAGRNRIETALAV